MKILVVDDEKIILQGIAKLLKANSLVSEVYCAEDAFIALDFLKCHRVDVVVTDIRMPGMDGLEMLRRLREEGCEAKFILLTAYSDFAYAQTAVKLGASDYLLKPFHDGELEAAVARIIEKSRSRAQAGLVDLSLIHI